MTILRRQDAEAFRVLSVFKNTLPASKNRIATSSFVCGGSLEQILEKLYGTHPPLPTYFRCLFSCYLARQKAWNGLVLAVFTILFSAAKLIDTQDARIHHGIVLSRKI